MIRHRWTVSIGVAVLVACGGSELRRALNDVIDKREDDAARQVEVFEAFDGELTAELMAEWQATPDGGCPVVEALPSMPLRTPGEIFLPAEEQRALQRARDEAQQALIQAYDRNVPAYHCDCIQKTLVKVRDAIEQRGPSQFETEREELDLLTEAELLSIAPLVRGRTDQFATDATRYVDAWNTRRHGEDGESGWQTAHERGQRRNVFQACDRF